MRLQMTMTDLDEERWAYLQRTVQAKYQIPEGVTRVCLTFSYGEQERHVEMAMGTLVSLLMGLGMVGVSRTMSTMLEQMSESLKRLQPETKPDPTLPLLPTPDMVRDLSAKEAADLARLINQPCEHGSPAVSFITSQFYGAPPVRTHSDGCQSYGPYTKPGEYAPPLAETYDPATGRYTIDPNKA